MRLAKCLSYVSNKPQMDHFDDLQIEEFSSFDFVEEMNECLLDDEEDIKSFDKLLNSNFDF